MSFLALVQWIVHRASTSRMWVRFLHAGPIILALALTTPATAKTKRVAPPVPDTQAVLLFDYKTNTIVESINIHKQLPIASVSKLMTVYVVLESRAELDERITITPVTIEGSKVIRPGMVTTRRELINLALISSDNYAAKMLAEAHPGGFGNFIATMNTTAKILGMQNTTFSDPSGLSVFNQSTAWDLHLLNSAINKYSVFTDAAMSKTSYQRAENKKGKITEFVIRNTSALAGEYDIRIGKTGFTNAAKWCISMQVRMAANSFDVIVLGSPTKEHRNKLARNLINTHIGRLAGYSTMHQIEQLDGEGTR